MLNIKKQEITVSNNLKKKIKCPKCNRILKCKGSDGKKRKYMYYNCEHCHFNINEKAIEKEFEKIVCELLLFDETYNNYCLPLFAEKETTRDRNSYDIEINELNEKKQRIKNAYMSGAVELDDFKEDLRVVNERLNILNKEKQKHLGNGIKRSYNVENIMVQRDISRIFINQKEFKKFTIQERNLMSVRDKQDFISRFIESITFDKDPEASNGIKIKDIKLKSVYKEKVNQLTNLGLAEIPIELNFNGVNQIVTLSQPLSRTQFNNYIKELEDKNIKY